MDFEGKSPEWVEAYLTQLSQKDPEYAKWLKQELAHRAVEKETGYWGARAAGVLFLSKPTQEIGLALRSMAVQHPNTYGTVGGAIDEDEDLEESVKREVAEEIGINIASSRLYTLDVFKDKNFSYTTFAVVCNKFTPTHLNWESAGFKWFKLNAMPRNLHPGVKSTLTKPDVISRIKNLLELI